MTKKIVTIEMEDDMGLTIPDRLHRTFGSQVKILRVMDEDLPTVQQIHHAIADKPSHRLVFIGEPEPDTGNKFVDLMCILEHAVFSNVIRAIEDYWERQADAVDCGNNLEQLNYTLRNIFSTQEGMELWNFPLDFGRHLNAGGVG
jgi:hypothetical protein